MPMTLCMYRRCSSKTRSMLVLNNNCLRSEQNQPTRQSQWDGAKHANSIVHVQTLIIEDQINLGLGQIIHSIPEMEVQAPAGDLAGKGGKLPGGSIMTVHLQLSIQSSCVSNTMYVTDCHKSEAAALYATPSCYRGSSVVHGRLSAWFFRYS